MPTRFERRLAIGIYLGLVPPGLLLCQERPAVFLSFADAEEVILNFKASDATSLPERGFQDALVWKEWIRARDWEIRSRIERGA